MRDLPPEVAGGAKAAASAGGSDVEAAQEAATEAAEPLLREAPSRPLFRPSEPVLISVPSLNKS
ncbi:MAG: hypothetical protein MJA30_17745, partial [Cytophagales bacterium]|nr:hypothetical protein [Cytophagales bacterium]